MTDTRRNRPGLARIDYRIGTHASFLDELRARLPLARVPAGPHAGSRPLAALGTRDNSDPSIAVLDAAAVLLDILTFYNERIANEGFLATATERLSVLQLARAIGYELGPGVAADATLVFTLGDTPGSAPSTSVIPAGTKVQSLPSGGGLPQTFETLADFTAHRAWNAVGIRAAMVQDLRVTADGGLERVQPDGTTEPTTELLLAGTALPVTAGDLLVAAVAGGTGVLRAVAVTEDRTAGVTRLQFVVPDGAVADGSPPAPPEPPAPLPAPGPLPLTADAVADVLAVALTEEDLQLLLDDRGWEPAAFLEAVAALAEVSAPEQDPGDGVFVLRHRLGLFGHNAQPYASLPISQRLGEWHTDADNADTFVAPLYPASWEGRTVWEDSQGTAHADADLHLERDDPDVLAGGWLVLAGDADGRLVRAYRITERHETSLADFGLTGQVTALSLTDADGTAATTPAFALRRTAAHAASRRLDLAPLPLAAAVGDTDVELAGMVLGLTPGRSVVVTGQLADPEGVPRAEVATIDTVTHHRGRTTLHFATALANEYLRETVTVQANVVRATHGETAYEVLGGGDAGVGNQSFALRGVPLTYVAAPTATGSDTTLEVHVGGRRWEERRSLYGAGSEEQVYTVHLAADGTPIVTFGDGIAGARPATGSENITARYRSGTGPTGEVDADTISLLLTRPPGVTAVTNPLPAAGAEAPEDLGDARANAPMTVRTLDRVVSLTDYEDFAATYAGIGKARADVLRHHGTRLVHLTVASASGGPVTAERLTSLLDALDGVRDPGETVCASTFDGLSFDVIGAVKTDPALVRDTVLAAVHAALTDAFGFPARRFGQGVPVAEILAVCQGVAGVVAVDIDELHVNGAGNDVVVVPPLGVLPARGARMAPEATALGCDTVEPAELLLINPGGISLGVLA